MKKEPNPQHTLSVYFCGQEDCGPNHSFGPAMRPHYLLHVIFHGKGIYQCSGHTYHLKAGDAFLIRPMDSIYYRADTSDPWSYDDLASTGNLLLILSDMQKKPSESRTDISNLYFQKASEYIRNNYAYPIQISDVAHYVGIDRSYLYRIFMEHENTSPKQYLLKHRLQMAAQLLCSSSCTITEAALSCGFRDAPSFCNYFRQGTGYTPKEFRKAYSGTIYT